MLLTLTDVGPSLELRAHVTEAQPYSLVAVFGGVPGGPTCSTSLPGTCVEMSAPRLMGTVTTDQFGRGTLVARLPANLVVGQDYVFQAVDRLGVGLWQPGEAVLRRSTMAASTPPPGDNVLIVVWDDVGIDSVSTYGATGGANTPRLDALAATGMRFDEAWAMPICAPTRATMLTGRFPRRTGYGSNVVPPYGVNELHPDQVTLAELAHMSPWYDYQTALVGKWHLSTLASPSGLLGPERQGFDAFLGTSGNIDAEFWMGSLPPADAGYYHWQRIVNSNHYVEEHTYATVRTTDDAVTVMDSLVEPWVLVVSYNGSHSPWEPPPEALHTRGPLAVDSPIPELQRAMTEAVDTEFGRLYDHIPPDVLGRTTIVVFGDNGTKREAIVPPYDPFRGKREVYDGGVRVPFVVAGPHVAPGTVSTSLVSVADIFPTVAELTGGPVDALHAALDPGQPMAIDGLSLLPVLANPTVPVHDLLYTERFTPGGSGPYLYDRRAIRDGRYKLVYDAIVDREQFFEYLPGAVDEGPDLIVCGGGLTPEQDAARLALRAQLDARVASMPMDTSPYVDDPYNWSDGDPNRFSDGCPVVGDTAAP